MITCSKTLNGVNVGLGEMIKLIQYNKAEIEQQYLLRNILSKCLFNERFHCLVTLIPAGMMV